jgi:ankyrin repeat protein
VNELVDDKTALHYAVLSTKVGGFENVSIVKLLLEQKANPNLPNGPNGASALAIAKSQLDVAKLFGNVSVSIRFVFVLQLLRSISTSHHTSRTKHNY